MSNLILTTILLCTAVQLHCTNMDRCNAVMHRCLGNHFCSGMQLIHWCLRSISIGLLSAIIMIISSSIHDMTGSLPTYSTVPSTRESDKNESD